MNIALFGAPGSGKGTQSHWLVNRMGYVQISTGDLLRENVAKKTDLGLRVKGYLDQGALVPDDLVVEMVSEAVMKHAVGKAFILDGFPRNIVQAEKLNLILTKNNRSLDRVIFLDVRREELVVRLTGRRVCSSCGAVYHVQSKPSKKEGVCDICGGSLYQRSDDKEDVIVNRLKTYDESTSPLRNYYQNKGILKELVGVGTESDVFDRLKVLIESKQ